MRILGPIVHIQVQRSPLKVGEKPHRRYDPAPLIATPRLRLTRDGAIGLVNGREILDVHHRDHPQTRNNRTEKALSVGFTSHYLAMRQRYGEHMVLGCAGENIIVDLPRRVPAAELEGGMIILAADGSERVRLSHACVAHPCKPFSGFALGGRLVAPEELKATLQFMDEGTRGFYCVPETETVADIQIGDVLAVPE